MLGKFCPECEGSGPVRLTVNRDEKIDRRLTEEEKEAMGYNQAKTAAIILSVIIVALSTALVFVSIKLCKAKKDLGLKSCEKPSPSSETAAEMDKERIM